MAWWWIGGAIAVVVVVWTHWTAFTLGTISPDRFEDHHDRFEAGKRFGRKMVLMKLDDMPMREDRRAKLRHNLGLCGCSSDCCCYEDGD